MLFGDKIKELREKQGHLLREYPQKNARCGWKEFKNLKNSFCGDKDSNSFVETNKLPSVQFTMASDFPIAAFMNIGFSHHYAILSKVKDVEQRKFYIQFAADTKVKVEDLEKLL